MLGATGFSTTSTFSVEGTLAGTDVVIGDLGLAVVGFVTFD
jgi:hypothetical protein